MIKTRYIYYLLLAFLTFGGNTRAQTHVTAKSALPKHPRLLMTKEDEKVLKQNLASDAFWAENHAKFLTSANKILYTDEMKYVKTGKRLLPVSRKAFYRIFTLSYAYRMTNDARYLERCKKEMLAISNFPDWNPSHFLDVAEMTTGLAIGYDWLYDKLDKKTRNTIRNSLIKKGLEPSLRAENNNWLARLNNWNQVCNTGMLFAALATFESNPTFSAETINRSINSIRYAMEAYAPHGAYPEGYGYWQYGTTFNVMFIDALEKIYGKSFGLTEMPGFMQSAKYIQHMLGVTMSPYNYGDMDPKARLNVATFWFADKNKDYSLVWNEYKQLKDDEILASFGYERFIPLMFLWGSNIKSGQMVKPREKSFFSQGIAPVWLMRSSWNDDNALYLGFKTGTPSSGHAHMDVGSFIFEAMGERWAIELGANDYNALELQNLDIWNMGADSDRWRVVRYNNLAHNTLTFNGKHQNVTGNAIIDNRINLTGFSGVSTDLSSLYTDEVRGVYRTIGLVENTYLSVIDRINTNYTPATAEWRMLTASTPVILNDSVIELSQNGKKLLVKFGSEYKATPEILSAQPLNNYEDTNDGVFIINFKVLLPANSSSILAVELIPQY